MKKFFLLLIIYGLSGPILNAQNDTPCSANWWAYCCRCAKCLVVDPLPSFGYCRHCNLLCPNCRKELGDLDKALDNLKNKNKVLLERMKVYQSEANRHNSKLTDALVKTYGQESGHWTVSDPSTWRNLTLSGYNSSFGKFTVAAGNLATNFGGGFGVGMLFNTLATIQSSDAIELEGNISQILLNIVTEEGIVKVYATDPLISEAARKMMDGFKRRQLIPPINQFNQTTRRLDILNKAGKGVNIFANLYGLVTAGADLLSNIGDIYDSYKAREWNEAERKKLQEEIEKNVDMMLCIKETQDSLKSGGLGFKKNQGTNDYAVNMLLGFILSEILNDNFNHTSLDFSYNDNYWDVDTIKIKLAMVQLKKQDALLKTMAKDILEKVIPPLMPWILNRWKEIQETDQRKLLQMAKTALAKIKKAWEQVSSLSESIIQNLGTAVIANEIALMSDPGFVEIPKDKIDALKMNKGPIASPDKWSSASNEKIKGDMGRVNMGFPVNSEWVLEFYNGDDYIGSRSRNDRENFYETSPGSYKIELNNVPVGTVLIEKGKEVKLKYGYLNILSRGHWWLYDESKEKYYKGDNKPLMLALPVGTYVLQFEEKARSNKYYLIKITQGMSMKFELPIVLNN